MISLERAQIQESEASWNDFVLVMWWKLLIWGLCQWKHWKSTLTLEGSFYWILNALPVNIGSFTSAYFDLSDGACFLCFNLFSFWKYPSGWF